MLTMEQRLYVLLAIAILALFVSQYISSRRSPKYKLPPRVPGVPIFGNALQVPPTQQGPWAQKLAQQYGEM